MESALKESYIASCLKKGAIENILTSLTHNEKLDTQVEVYLLEIAHNFIETNIESACMYAKHKGNDNISGEDIALSLEKNFNIGEIVSKNTNNAMINNKISDINKQSTADHIKRLELTKEENRITLD